jgi:aspartate/methionine/tyrosine aminotransferase
MASLTPYRHLAGGRCIAPLKLTQRQRGNVVQLEPFLLDEWLDAAMNPPPRWNLGSVAGPVWEVAELLKLAGENEDATLLRTPLRYSRSAGLDELRVAIAERHAVSPEEVIVVTGASEALLLIFFRAAVPGHNVVVPTPCFPPTVAIPRALGLEVRTYRLRPEMQWAIDLDEINALVDARTEVLLINSPHNPTGAVVSDWTKQQLRAIAEFHGASFVADEVFHPIYYGPSAQSARQLGATVIGDASKALSMPGLRIGWIIEPTPGLRADYLRGRMNFTGTNSPVTERLALIAYRHADTVLDRAQRIAAANLQLFGSFMDQWPSYLDWVVPAGGMSAFPWLQGGVDARPLCDALLAAGILTVPGDAFGFAPHFRVGFAAEDNMGPALEAAARVVQHWFPRLNEVAS